MLYRLILACLLCLVTVSAGRAQETARPGAFDYFLLALSWSPQYCAQHGKERAAASQCHRHNAYGFVAHGLWPEADNGPAPTSCRTSAPLSDRLLDRMMPIMPSSGLIKHEWATHGSCSGLSADDYFDSLSQAFRKVQIPPQLTGPGDAITTDATRIKQWFQEANPGLRTDMMTLQCDMQDATLREIRFCFSKSLDLRPCGATQTDHCPSGSVRIRSVP